MLSALRTIVFIKVVLLITCDDLARSNTPDLVALSLSVKPNGLVLTPAATRMSYNVRSTQRNVGNPARMPLGEI
jgi:hypothetical protein